MKPKSLEEEFLNRLVCFSFRDHFENTGGAEQLQAYSLIKFLMQQFFFVGIFFLARNKKNAASKYKSARKQCQVSWSVRLDGVLRSALILNLHMICLTC